MNNRIWYEVFLSDENGTRTLQIASTLGEAHVAQKNWEKRKDYKDKTILIDKWQNTDSPVYIGEVI